MKVRIAVACGEHGLWRASGASCLSPEESMRNIKDWVPRPVSLMYVTAEIPDHHFQPAVVQGQVAEEATDE